MRPFVSAHPSVSFAVIAAGILLSLWSSGGCAQEKRIEAVVTRVVDGDTIRVSYQGKSDTVRLIGIDAPESRNNRKAKKDSARSERDIEETIAMGRKSTEFVKGLIHGGSQVALELDVQERNHYHRLLAYVYLPDGRMLNEEIVRAGYAAPMTVPPNVKYAGTFSRAYREARENKRGLWIAPEKEFFRTSPRSSSP